MDERLLQKMIINSFLQYYDSEESIPLSIEEFKQMVKKIKRIVEEADEGTVHEIIEDTVYDYVTNK